MDHNCQGRSQPGGCIVGSDVKVRLTVEADCQASIHSVFTVIAVMSDYCTMTNRYGFRLCWILSKVVIFICICSVDTSCTPF